MEKCLLGDTIATSCTLDSISVAGGSTSEALKAFAGQVDVLHGGAVSAVIESMTGARFVHDTLECCGWRVEVADAQKVKGLARLACKTDRIDSMVLATLSQRDLIPSVRLPGSRGARARSLTAAAGQAQVDAQEPASTPR